MPSKWPFLISFDLKQSLPYQLDATLPDSTIISSDAEINNMYHPLLVIDQQTEKETDDSYGHFTLRKISERLIV